MADKLTTETLAEDLSIAAELGGEWGYGIKDGTLFAEHYADDGEIDRTVIINVSFENNGAA